MKYILLISLALGAVFTGCNSNAKSKNPVKTNLATVKPADNLASKTEITVLIRQMLKWADSEHSNELLPAIAKDSICIGFDMDKLRQTEQKLKETGFFADEFINNYDHIIRTLDKKIKDKEYQSWNIYELPTFAFANDVSPYCLCQDNMSWDKVEVEVVKLSNDKGELKWNWGKLDAGTDDTWKDFSYKFAVIKTDGKWRISYLQGFDYNDSVKS